MFGLTFLNTVFLAGLAAAALPILIHLFSRRKAKDIPFSSIEYLREISLRKIRRMKLRQWLLLALRVLIVALFAMAMGRPAIRGSASPITRGSSTVAILLDNSYSMSAARPDRAGDLPSDLPADTAPGTAPSAPGREGGPGAAGPGGASGGSSTSAEVPLGASAGTLAREEGTLYEAAKQRALEVIGLMGEGDQGILALTGRPVRLPFQTPVANLALLRQEVLRSSLSAGGSDLPVALERALAVLNSARTINKEIFIISDFQKRDLEAWAQNEEEGAHGGALASLLGDAQADTLGTGEPIAIPPDVRVYLIPTRGKAQENVSIERVRYSPGAGATGTGQVVATVVNHGDDSITDRVIRVTPADRPGEILADGLMTIPPHAETDVELDLPQVPQGGALTVGLGADLLDWDNHAYLVTADPGVRKVLLIGGESDLGGGPAGTTASGAGEATPDPLGLGLVNDVFYIRKALDPGGDGKFHQVTVSNVDALSDPAGWDADVVILSNVGRLPRAAVENLGRFRARGGGIFIALGDRVDLRYYNSQLLQELSSIELVNVTQDEGPGTYRSLRPTAIGHPIFQGFPLSPGDDLGSARFRKLVECKIGEGARVIADFGGQIPALIEQDGLILFTSSLDGSWNDFVTSASFLPTIHQIVGYLAARAKGESGPRTVGSNLEKLVEAQSLQEPVFCLDPLGGRSPVEALPVDSMVRLRSTAAAFPGIYRFVDDSGNVLASFAVNLDAREGDLTVASPELETRLFGPSAHRLEVSQTITRDLLEGRYGRELWRIFLMAVLVLLAVESLLGRGKLLI